MSNGRKNEDDRDDDEEDIEEVSGGAVPHDIEGFVPADVDTPYPRFPGGPIVRIDPPVKPTLD